MQARPHHATHLDADLFLYEFLRDGEPVAQGEPGEVHITSLHNDTMPLLRYQQGDIMIPDPPQPCPCGRTLPTVREIQGRRSDGLLAANGIRLPPGLLIDHLETTLGLREYQIQQTTPHHVAVKIRPESYTPPLVATLASYLTNLLGDGTTLHVETWDGQLLPLKY